MKEFTINKNDAGQRLDKYLAKAVPLLPGSLMHKYLRLKRIKLNGKRCSACVQINYEITDLCRETFCRSI